eukprot:Hpha_TRINITY_DN16611_c2_g2::TRINITY_DN16611_c2_g2_i1::g.179625::m.179625
MSDVDDPEDPITSGEEGEEPTDEVYASGAVHPHAFIQLGRAEGKRRQDVERKQVRGIMQLNEDMLELVDSLLRGIDALKQAAAQHQRALEHDRKRVGNEQMRQRGRIEDDWLRGYEKLLYVDFIDGARKARQKAGPPTRANAAATRGIHPAHGSGRYAVVNLQNYPRSRAVQQSLFR